MPQNIVQSSDAFVPARFSVLMRTNARVIIALFRGQPVRTVTLTAPHALISQFSLEAVGPVL